MELIENHFNVINDMKAVLVETFEDIREEFGSDDLFLECRKKMAELFSLEKSVFDGLEKEKLEDPTNIIVSIADSISHPINDYESDEEGTDAEEGNDVEQGTDEEGGDWRNFLNNNDGGNNDEEMFVENINLSVSKSTDGGNKEDQSEITKKAVDKEIKEKEVEITKDVVEEKETTVEDFVDKEKKEKESDLRKVVVNDREEMVVVQETKETANVDESNLVVQTGDAELLLALNPIDISKSDRVEMVKNNENEPLISSPVVMKSVFEKRIPKPSAVMLSPFVVTLTPAKDSIKKSEVVYAVEMFCNDEANDV